MRGGCRAKRRGSASRTMALRKSNAGRWRRGVTGMSHLRMFPWQRSSGGHFAAGGVAPRAAARWRGLWRHCVFRVLFTLTTVSVRNINIKIIMSLMWRMGR